MKKTTTYKAANTIAPVIEEYFKRLISLGNPEADKCSFLPSADVIESIIDHAFWASLRKEEGRSPKISLAYISPDQAENPMLLSTKVPMEPHLIAKIAPGFERAGIHLGVWQENDELFIWGSTHTIPSYCFVLDVPEPGLLVVKHKRLDDFAKFANVAVLNGDEIKMVDEQSVALQGAPPLLKALLETNLSSPEMDTINVLVQLAVSIRNHGRGGTLIIVPKGSKGWRHSLRHPVPYTVKPAFSGLKRLIKENSLQKNQNAWQVNLKREIDAIAGLTAIDGAIVMNEEFELLAFGAKIIRLKGSGLVEELLVTEPVKGGERHVIQPGQGSGTRHLSAAQFVYDQKDAIVLVASQDGRFTVFAWSEQENMVQAHRIEVLLL